MKLKDELLQTAIFWALFLAGAVYWLESSTDGIWTDATLGLLVIAPILEEYYKFIGYRWLKGYTIVVPITFTVFEAVQYFFVSPGAGTGADRMLGAAFSSIALLMIFKHVNMWAVGYFFRFRVWSLPLMILAHAAWNWWAMNYGTEAAHPGESLIAFTMLFVGFALMRERHPKLGTWLDKNGSRIFWGLIFVTVILASIIALMYVQWTWVTYDFEILKQLLVR